MTNVRGKKTKGEEWDNYVFGIREMGDKLGEGGGIRKYDERGWRERGWKWGNYINMIKEKWEKWGECKYDE